MKVVDRFNVSKQPEGPRKFSFEFSGPGLVSIVVVAVLGIVWVFILGVLVGRGWKPEETVPQVAQIMPAPAPAQNESKEPPTVLKPEQLDFQDTLQGKKPAETVTVDSSAKPQEDKPATISGGAAPAPAATAVPTSTLATTPAAVPKGKVATAPAKPDSKAANTASADKPADAKKDAKDSKDSKKSKDSKDKKFQATYQVAAFDEKAQAQSEAERFMKKGLKVSVKEVEIKGKTYFRVLATLSGTNEEMVQTLEKAGAKKPILRDKKSL